MRLIDADEVIDRLRESYSETAELIQHGEHELDTLAEGYTEAAHVVKFLTGTVDAVPVVRCRECKYYAPGSGCEPTCTNTAGMLFPDDNEFCSQGEREKANG